MDYYAAMRIAAAPSKHDDAAVLAARDAIEAELARTKIVATRQQCRNALARIRDSWAAR